MLTELCRWAKMNINGGGVFANDVKAKVADVIKDIKKLL